MHPDLIAALAEDRRKSLTRAVWRRHIGRSARHAARRRTNRQARGRVWIFAVAASMLRTIGKGAKS